MGGPKALATAWRAMTRGLTAASCADDVHKEQATSVDDAPSASVVAATLVPSGGRGLWS